MSQPTAVPPRPPMSYADFYRQYIHHPIQWRQYWKGREQEALEHSEPHRMSESRAQRYRLFCSLLGITGAPTEDQRGLFATLDSRWSSQNTMAAAAAQRAPSMIQSQPQPQPGQPISQPQHSQFQSIAMSKPDFQAPAPSQPYSSAPAASAHPLSQTQSNPQSIAARAARPTPDQLREISQLIQTSHAFSQMEHQRNTISLIETKQKSQLPPISSLSNPNQYQYSLQRFTANGRSTESQLAKVLAATAAAAADSTHSSNMIQPPPAAIEHFIETQRRDVKSHRQYLESQWNHISSGGDTASGRAALDEYLLRLFPSDPLPPMVEPRASPDEKMMNNNKNGSSNTNSYGNGERRDRDRRGGGGDTDGEREPQVGDKRRTRQSMGSEAEQIPTAERFEHWKATDWAVDLNLLTQKMRQIAGNHHVRVENDEIVEFVAASVQTYMKEIFSELIDIKRRRLGENRLDNADVPTVVIAEPAEELKEWSAARRKKNEEAAAQLPPPLNVVTKIDDRELSSRLVNDPRLGLTDLLTWMRSDPDWRKSGLLQMLITLQMKPVNQWPKELQPAAP